MRAQNGEGTRARNAAWAPSRRELRKYASLFLQTDANRDGFVEGAEAHRLCERSGLNDSSLSQAWRLSDQDQDGRLHFGEFVYLVHLISCLTRGLEAAILEAGLPRQLQEAVGAISESPQELAAQRSRSSSAASRATSPASSSSPAPSAPMGFQGAASGGDRAPHESGRSAGRQLPLSEGLPGWEMPPRGAGPQLSGLDALVSRGHTNGRQKDNEKKPNRRSKGSAGEADQYSRGQREDRFHTARSDDSSMSPHFGHDRGQKQDRFSFDPLANVTNLKSHFGAILESDRILLRGVQRVVDELEDDLRKKQDVVSQSQQQLRRDREESNSRVEVQRQLERQLVLAKGRLSELREMRASMDVDSASFWRDRDHFSQELAMMRNTFDSESLLLEKLKNASDHLERSHKAHADHTRQLENQRKDVLEMLERENRLLQRDERQTEEARAALERLRREQGDSKGITVEEVDILKHRGLALRGEADSWLRSSADSSTNKDPKSVSSVRSTPKPSPVSEPRSEVWRDSAAATHNVFDPHSWASSLVGGTFGLPAASAGSLGGDPRSREGV